MIRSIIIHVIAIGCQAFVITNYVILVMKGARLTVPQVILIAVCGFVAGRLSKMME